MKVQAIFISGTEALWGQIEGIGLLSGLLTGGGGRAINNDSLVWSYKRIRWNFAGESDCDGDSDSVCGLRGISGIIYIIGHILRKPGLRSVHQAAALRSAEHWDLRSLPVIMASQ